MANYKGTIISFASGGLLSYAAWISFLKGILNGFTTDYNLYDGAMLLGFIAAVFVVVLVIKDMFDGGGWNRFEKKKAQMAGLILIGLFVLGFVVAKYWAGSYTLTAVNTNSAGTAGDFKTENGVKYVATGMYDYANIEMTVNTAYVALGAAANTSFTAMYIYFNQSWISWNALKAYRGFNITVGDDGLTAFKLQFYDKNAGSYTDLLTSADDTNQVFLSDEGTTSELNVTFTMADILGWQASHVFNDPDDKLILYFTISSDFAENTATVINWYWSSVGSDLSYLIVVICWCGMGVIPLMMMMNVFSKAKGYYKRRGYRRRRKYRRRRR